MIRTGPSLRSALLWALEQFGPGDVVMRHPWTGDRIVLNAFRHKGYWFHGRRRERKSIELCERLVEPGQVVFDVGGHIGFTAVLFARMGARVVVFEPGPNNLPYIRMNTANLEEITLVEVGVGCQEGHQTLYCEDLTGQNNSFVPGYSVLAGNEEMAHRRARVNACSVAVTTLDRYVESTGSVPGFIKVDVEGYELEVLSGARWLLDGPSAPPMLIEVTRESASVADLVRGLGYLAFSPSGRRIGGAELRGNCFFLHPEKHGARIDKAGLVM